MLLASSCTQRLTDFTVISTKNVPIGTGVRPELIKGDKRVEGKDLSHTVLFIPLGSPNLKEAIDKAIESVPGAIGLVDGVVKQKSWWAFLYGQNSYIVEGTPLFAVNEDENNENDYQNPSARSHKTNKIKKAKRTYIPEEETDEENNNESSDESTLVFLHEVKPAETIGDIAKQYNVSVADIIKWNNLKNSKLTRGKSLIIHIPE